jgi:hypothetical protein
MIKSPRQSGVYRLQMCDSIARNGTKALTARSLSSFGEHTEYIVIITPTAISPESKDCESYIPALILHTTNT